MLTPAIRYDYHKSFGSHTSPNLGATYFISDKSRFKANYGTSYRAPSVDELYGAFTHGGIWGGMAIVGNPDLKPEKSKGWEISYEQEFGDTTSAKLTYFDNKKEDAISYKIEMASPSQMGKFYNIDSTSSKGVEFEIKHDFGKGFTLVGNYNWLDSVDDTTGERLNYNARNTYMAKLMWTEPIKKEWNITAWNNGTLTSNTTLIPFTALTPSILQLLNAGVINTVFSPVSIMYLTKIYPIWDITDVCGVSAQK